MQVPSILQGATADASAARRSRRCHRNNVYRVLLGGWSLGSTADKMAKERSELAVIAALCARVRRQVPCTA